jgi:hypothetical protein
LPLTTTGRRTSLGRQFLLTLAAVAFAIAGQLVPASPAVSTAAAAPAPLKAVFIVGPAHEATDGYLEDAERMARQAEAVGMDTRRVFYPNATWENVLAHIQGANFVVYMGHGYGWPSPYTAIMKEARQNGMGLNSWPGSARDEYTYYGAIPIKQNVRLAPNAIVMLAHLCYSAGNGESHMPLPSQDLARERVDNFANGFLAAGAGAVFALSWGTWSDFPRALATTDQTMDQLFMTPGEHNAWKDLYFDSVRTPGTKNHLDPSPTSGYHRAVSGRLNMTTADFRGGAGQVVPPPPPPMDGPLLTMTAPTAARIFPSDSDALAQRTTFKVRLAVPSNLNWRIVNAAGATVRTARNGSTPAGTTAFTWDGKSDSGSWVPEGWYRSLATVDAGTGPVTTERSVFVGAFEINPATTTATRGASLKFSLRSTEGLSGAPQFQVHQPGHSPWTVTATRVSGLKYKVTVTLKQGSTGYVTFVAVGRDKNGGNQASSLSLPLN